ncbi:WxL domain-containing protein [Enterococcus sp. 5H]|uniref:WxL domain-containing protein n=1 Tax=Enterococcus sp. 5H TaxID=1229490 RepID=UPI0023022141|nr:WxL domain-containing protein [Enterococcus sp. 5H]MDA9471612.1 hypothetical protein [Enterococcus sp. 5H]
MKLLNLATIGLLSTSILAGGVTAFAEEVRNVTTDGEISFTAVDEDGEGEDTEVIPPEGEDGPDVEIPPVEGPDGGNKGPLTIAYAPTMNFGSQVISNQDRAYSMVAEMQQLAGTTGDENKVPYTSFAQVQDTRGTNGGWDLQVSLSNFTSGTQNGTLTGAEISLRDPRIQYEGSNAANAPAAHASRLNLRPGTGSVSVMTADPTKGAGVSSVVWGNQADLDEQFEDDDVDVVKNDAIVLSIPGSTAKDAATYSSTLTWELTATPGDDVDEDDEEDEDDTDA